MLELDGTLRRGEPFDESLPEGEGSAYISPTVVRHPVVHGRSAEAGEFTLLDVYSDSILGPMQEHMDVLRTTWHVGAVLHGDQIAKEHLSFDRMRLSLDYLVDWAKPPPLDVTIGLQPTDVTAHATTTVIDEATISGTAVDLLDVATFSTERREIRVGQHLIFEVSTGKPGTWHELTERWVILLRDLLTFATLRPNRADLISLRLATSPDSPRAHWCELTIRTLDWQREERSERQRGAKQQLLTLEDFEGGLSALLPRWMDLRETYESVISLLLGVDYAPFMYGQQRFLALVQAGEILHATRYPSALPVPKEEHHNRVDEVMNADIPTEHREWVNKTLRESNWMSLSMRLTELFDRCSPIQDAIERYGGDTTEVVRTLVRTRNALTHEGPSAGAPLDLHGMFWASRLLAWLIRYNLLEELGLSEDRPCELAERNPDFDACIRQTLDNL